MSIDVVYFNSRRDQAEFEGLVRSQLEHGVEISNADDQFKGLRLEVRCPDECDCEYMILLIHTGYAHSSLLFGLLAPSKEWKQIIVECAREAMRRYPEKFKKKEQV